MERGSNGAALLTGILDRRRVQAVPAHERVLSILEDAPVELKEERCPSTS